jgi:hypothetical protein
VNTCGCDWRDDYICSWHRQVQDEVERVAEVLTARMIEADKVTTFSERLAGVWSLNDIALLHEWQIDVRSVVDG